MNDTIKNIYERRAVRKYKAMPVAREAIEQLIAAGKMAPSAMNRQPWKFYVLTGKEKIGLFSKEIAHIALGHIKDVSAKEALKMTLSMFHFSAVKDMLTAHDHVFYGAPAVIFITSPRADEWGALDVGMCAQNIMLAAKSMGLDTCPVGFAKFVMQTKDYYQLNIPASEQVDLAIIVGYGNETPTAHERIGNNVTYL